MNAIIGAAGYVPPWRITRSAVTDQLVSFDARGIESTAVPAPDEDALTMAAEASSRALSITDRPSGEVSFLAVATTTPPLAEEDWSVNLATMLGAPDTATTHIFTGSTRAGTRALTVGLETDLQDGVGVVVASDCPRGRPSSGFEHAAGAGAAAFVLDSDGPVAVTETASYTEYRPGTRFREADSTTVEGLESRRYDRNGFIQTMQGAVDQLDGTAEAVVMQAPDGSLPYRAARELGIDTDVIAPYLSVGEIGDLGAASVPYSLANALGEADSVLALSHGSGAGADALRFVREGKIPVSIDDSTERELEYGEYLRFRGELAREPVSGGGAYVSVPSWRRSVPARYRIEAGRCENCSAVTFPAEGVCRECGHLGAFEPIELDRTGVVETVTTISAGGAPPEFAVQQSRTGDFQIAIVAFDVPDGTPVSVPVQVVQTEEALAIGDEVEWTIRRIFTQEGVTRYGGKVRPV